MILQGTRGGNFDTSAASGESTASVFLWKHPSRPIGVRVCRAAQFNFFSTAFDPREWTMVVYWKENSRRQLQLFPSPPNCTFPDDPDVPLWTLWTPEPQEPPGSLGLRMASSSVTCW